MEWLLLHWWLGLTIDDPHAPEAGDGERGRATPVDLELVRAVYEFVATQTRCSVCCAPLRRAVRVSHDHAPAQVRVTTRCGGWWRHRHRAGVLVEPTHELVFEPLRPR